MLQRDGANRSADRIERENHILVFQLHRRKRRNLNQCLLRLFLRHGRFGNRNGGNRDFSIRLRRSSRSSGGRRNRSGGPAHITRERLPTEQHHTADRNRDQRLFIEFHVSTLIHKFEEAVGPLFRPAPPECSPHGRPDAALFRNQRRASGCSAGRSHFFRGGGTGSNPPLQNG